MRTATTPAACTRPLTSGPSTAPRSPRECCAPRLGCRRSGSLPSTLASRSRSRASRSPPSTPATAPARSCSCSSTSPLATPRCTPEICAPHSPSARRSAQPCCAAACSASATAATTRPLPPPPPSPPPPPPPLPPRPPTPPPPLRPLRWTSSISTRPTPRRAGASHRSQTRCDVSPPSQPPSCAASRARCSSSARTRLARRRQSPRSRAQRAAARCSPSGARSR
mmetsp:Transcript_34012/g.112596  ORF Transcript_34012/g.112596 Transcript_34012/m.112596 type:complete len:224 (+) Transcript_34012:193-864(+)